MIPQPHLDNIKKSFEPAVPPLSVKKIPHRIKIDGEFVKVKSGKTIWNNIGPAKNAVRNHLEHIRGRFTEAVLANNPTLDYRTDWRKISDLEKGMLDEFIKNHVEFVPVEEVLIPEK